MPGTIKVRVLSARELPVMDRASETADAFVEVKFCQTAYKTDIYPKSLNPQWMSDWFTFEADDEEMQDECLQFRVMDYDTYSANDAIGRVYVDLNPLLSKNGPSQIAGWLPIYDTMHGIRGELNVVVKIDLFTDINKFRQSSCGVDVFATPGIPCGYQLIAIHGLVDELLANDDPEYQWIDKIRTPRASNEARQVLFSKMAGQLVRRMGRKVLEMGGNAVIGYQQFFDLEGETGVVSRGLGTSVTLEKTVDLCTMGSPGTPEIGPLSGPHLWETPVAEVDESVSDDGGLQKFPSTKPQRITSERRTVSATASSSRDSSSSSGPPVVLVNPVDGEIISGIPVLVRANSHSPGIAGSATIAVPAALATGMADVSKTPVPILLGDQNQQSQLMGMAKSPFIRQPANPVRTIDLMEYPFFTMQVYPVGFVFHLGSVVCARSVKLLSVIETPEESDLRHVWWQELRNEIRSHMKAIACNSVVGYREQTTVFKDVCILSAMGTAAVVDPTCWVSNTQYAPVIPEGRSVAMIQQPTLQTVPSVDLKDKDKALKIDVALANRCSFSARTISSSQETFSCCSPCHIPYSEYSLPFPVKLASCGCCGNGFVPNLLLTTIDPLAEVGINGDFTLVQARVVRRKQDANGETLANELSDMLPFIEHELHSQLASKLLKAEKNAIYGLRTDISIGETHIAVIATGTAVCLAALDSAPRMVQGLMKHMVAEDVEGSSKFTDADSNSQVNRSQVVSKIPSESCDNGTSKTSLMEQRLGTSTIRPPIDLMWDRDAVIAEVTDDSSPDMRRTSERLETDFPKGFHCCNTYLLPNAADWNTADMRQLQLFVRVAQGPMIDPDEFDTKILSDRINWLIKSTCFKFRKLKPICLANVDCEIGFPQNDQYQITFIGMALTANIESPHLQKISQEQMALSISQPSSSWSSGILSPGRRYRQSSSSSAVSFTHGQATDEHTTTNAVLAHLDSSSLSLDHGEQLSSSCPTSTFQALASVRKRRVSASAADETPAIKSRQIFVTPLPIPGHAPICHYLGHYDFFFIRETTSLREIGGLESFTHATLTEVLYVVQAHVAAFGGHGMVAFRFTQVDLSHNSGRNQAQCLVAVAGDIVTTMASLQTNMAS